MTQFIILSKLDISMLCNDESVSLYIDGTKFTLCTDTYYEIKERGNKEWTQN